MHSLASPSGGRRSAGIASVLRVAGFAPNDLVIAAQSPFELVRQGIDALASSIGGSSPATAVFTKGELAIEKAIFFASVSFLQLITFIDINLEDPSPSDTTLFAKLRST